ncbi:DUF1826 domain-containing protein [Alishewanella aestuarii]|uniref:DUF1826 domain-containing protein n=1 Tax=Alishewanella aestuarii TaxID=453835 RepID=UPI001EE69033|nr:DUF1826 domain-containing protein [Alishewanella aestuarii]
MRRVRTTLSPIWRYNNARGQQLQQADVALLKGSGWENMATYAISHRSPALAAPRLLLTLDPVWQD